MKQGLYNFLQFVISIILGLSFSYVLFDFILWEFNTSLWTELERLMQVLFGVIAAIIFNEILFPSDEGTANDKGYRDSHKIDDFFDDEDLGLF